MNALSRIPWKLSAQSKRVVVSDGDTRICEAQTVDAAFIVRAVNSHEALKKFAQWVLKVEPENSLLALNARHALKSIA